MIKKINQILDKKLKKMLFIFFLVISLISILEILSIGLIIPLITSILNEDILRNYLQNNLIFFDNFTNSQITIFLFSLMVFIYFVKAITLLFFSWLQLSYVTKLEATLCKKLYSSYLNRPYKFFTNINSSVLIRNITEEVQHFSNSIIFNGLNLFLEILIVVFISIFLFFYNPLVTFQLILLCFVISFLFIKLTKKKLSIWAKERQSNAEMKIKHIQQGIGGIKEIKILGNEKKFVEYFNNHNQRYATINKYFNMITQSSRIILEFFAILFFCLIVIYSHLSGIKNSEILVLIAVFAAAAFRLLPSFNRINVSFSNIRYGMPSIDILYQEKNNISLIEKKNQNNVVHNLNAKKIFNSSIRVEKLYFGYNKINVLENVNLEIQKNSIIGIVGSSGSGKSTFVDLILDLQKPNKGSIYIDNLNISSLDQTWRNFIGYVPQNIYLLDDTLKKNIAFGLDEVQIDDKKIFNSLKLSQLDDFVSNNLKDGINTNIGEGGIRLSGGQRQRIGIARALYKNPELIIFDESTSSLDLKTEERIIETIKSIRQNKTFIIISHRTSTLKVCDVVYEIKDKKFNKLIR